MTSDDLRQDLWVPDNPDGSGWADIDWTSAVRGSRYHYRHGEPLDEALAALPPFFRIVTRSETEQIPTPHENTYYVPAMQLHDFMAELVWSAGSETIWHIEPCADPPEEARVR
jgi:hypothetical protein